MSTAEVLRFSPEQQQAYRQIAEFFGRAEREFPAAAKQLVNVVGGLVGEQRTTKEKLQQGMGNIDVGLALIGDWLKETGADGFEVKLGFGGGTKKAIGRTQITFPSVSDLIRVRGRVDLELQRQIPPLLSSFSRQIRGGLDVSLSPRQIVGGLLAESVGSRLSANGSADLREALNKPLGGHFEWIREALKIPDVATQPGFLEKTTSLKVVARQSAAEAPPREAEWDRKYRSIKQYLSSQEGRDFCSRTWDRDMWRFAGDGSVKRVYQPLAGPLRGLQVCLRENVTSDLINPYESAHELRKETRFLQRVKGQYFPGVYVYTPFRSGETSGLGQYSDRQHRDLVDFIIGTKVEQIRDPDRGIVWPKELTPAVRLNIVLAACWCETEATGLTLPVYLTDLKTDAFIVQPDGLVKLIDVQPQEEYAEASQNSIARELVRLCLELFTGERHYGTTSIERAIRGYLEPDWDQGDRRYLGTYNQPPTLEEIIRSADLPSGTERAIKDFLIWVRGKPPFNHVADYFRRAIQPIAQRLEREESRGRVDELERQMRAEAARRVERVLVPPVESQAAAARGGEMARAALGQAEENARSRIGQLGSKDLVPVETGVIVQSLLVSLDRLPEERRRRIAGDGYPDYKVPLAQLYSYILSSAVKHRANLWGREIMFPSRHPGEVAFNAMKSIVGLCQRPEFRLEYDDEAFNITFSRLIEALHRMTPAELDRLARAVGRENIWQVYADLVATVVGTRE